MSLPGEDDATSLDPEIVNPNANQQTTGDSKAAGEAQAQRLVNKTLENLDAETKAFVLEFQQRWGAYYTKLADEKKKKVAELAGKSTYDINLQKPTGGKVLNPLTGKEEVEYSEEWETQTYNRRKVNQHNWALLEQMKAEYAEELDDQVQRAKLYDKMHEGMAFMYLGMKPEDYKRADWEELKLVIDACVERTKYGLPNSQKGSSSSSMKGGLG